MGKFLQACKNGNMMLLHLTIQQRVNINCRSGTGLREAIRNKQKLAWQFLLKKPELDVNIVDNFGETALHVASRFNIAEAVEDLIKRKDVDINKRSFLGITAAILAAKCVSAEAFQVLMKDRRTIDDNIGAAINPSLKNSRNQIVDQIFACRLQQLFTVNPQRQTKTVIRAI